MSDDLALSVKDLQTFFYTNKRCNKAVNGVSFDIRRGKTLGIVGESGCGKSVTASSIMQLLPRLSRIEGGSITYHADRGDIRIDQLDRDGADMRRIRGEEIAMIFQDPMTALNPVYTVGYQIAEALKYHTDLDAAGRQKRVVELLTDMGIPLPEKRANEYPHQYSGGMRQRAMIAMAMSCNPKILIADEPTTALDVTIQAQILRLLVDLGREMNMAMILITHDLGVVARVADKVAVMYAGELVETGSADQVFNAPMHPYTRGLLRCIPQPGKTERGARLGTIPGIVPNLVGGVTGCPFRTRCDHAVAACREAIPHRKPAENHRFRCVHETGHQTAETVV